MSLGKKILAIALIVFVAAVLVYAAFLASYAFAVQDLAQYWAAAHLIATNPYSIDLTTHFERSQGIEAAPLVIKNPPWAIVMVLPLGLLGYHASFTIWTVLSVLIIAESARVIWKSTHAPPSLAPLILPFLFGPTIVMLMLGQFTAFVLLGVLLFCVFIERRQDSLAGASLLFLAGKPHVVLLFLLVVGLWTLASKRWQVLLSAFSGLAIASTLAVLINHHIFSQFRQRTILVLNETESYPNLGGFLYESSGLHALALLPQLAGFIWVLLYWRKHRSNWNWKIHGIIVLLVSVACSYYSYPYDEILAIPALLIAFAKGNQRAFVFSFLVVEMGYAVYLSNIAGHFGYHSMFLWWTGGAWLVTFLMAQTRFFTRASARSRSFTT